MLLHDPHLQMTCTLDEFDVEVLLVEAHRAARVVTAQLGLSMDAAAGLEVHVGEGPNEAVGNTIRICPPPARGGLSRLQWFELLFSHELTHVLVARHWGRPMALWWEGFPVALGDARVRTRVLETSYHAHCRALDMLGALLPMRPLLSAARYYSARADYRVDLQAGSWCDFLLQRHGPASLRACAHSLRLPVPEDPRLLVEAALQRHLGDDFDGLVEQWRHWLRQTCAPDDAQLEKLSARELGEVELGSPHCEFCFSPLPNERCPSCGCPAPGAVEIC